jgi:undecaprenyl-diphosphatase
METLFSRLAEGFDLPILDWIRAHLSCPALDMIMPPVTALANAGIFWILLAVALLLSKKHRGVGFRMGSALLIGLLVCNILMKPLFGRIRPYDYQLLHYGKTIPLLIKAETDFSFPSGHTIASFESAAVLMMCNKKWGIPALVLALLIGFSRLYLYVHYPTDVLCSVVLGMVIGILAHRLANHAEKYCRKKHA